MHNFQFDGLLDKYNGMSKAIPKLSILFVLHLQRFWYLNSTKYNGFFKDTNIYLILGLKEYPLDSSLVALIIGVADGLIVISYVLMIITWFFFIFFCFFPYISFSLSKSEEKARDEVLLHSLSASNFSLEFSNLPKIDKEKIIVQLKEFIEKVHFRDN